MYSLAMDVDLIDKKDLTNKLIYKLINCIRNEKIPKIDIKIDQKKYYGDYIDFFKWDDVTHPIMKGKDIFNRPFIIIKVIIDGDKFMQTFFQRYNDVQDLWMGCGNLTAQFMNTVGGIKMKQFELIINLINSYLENSYKKFKIIDDYRIREKYVGKSVEIYDEKKIYAYEKICNYWINCRYNPKYKICKKIANKKYSKINEEKNN